MLLGGTIRSMDRHIFNIRTELFLSKNIDIQRYLSLRYQNQRSLYFFEWILVYRSLSGQQVQRRGFFDFSFQKDDNWRMERVLNNRKGKNRVSYRRSLLRRNP